MSSASFISTPPNSIDGITVKRHALGELVKSLLKTAELEEALFEKLRAALTEGNREAVVCLAGELLSLRPVAEPKPENCTKPVA